MSNQLQRLTSSCDIQNSISTIMKQKHDTATDIGLIAKTGTSVINAIQQNSKQYFYEF